MIWYGGSRERDTQHILWKYLSSDQSTPHPCEKANISHITQEMKSTDVIWKQIFQPDCLFLIFYHLTIDKPLLLNSPRTCWCCASLWCVQSISVCGLQHENWWSSKIRNHALGWNRRWNLLQPWMLLAAHCLSTTLREQGRLPPILTRPSASSIIHVVFNMLHTHSVWGYNHAEIFVWD